jgi:hypothetical protein
VKRNGPLPMPMEQLQELADAFGAGMSVTEASHATGLTPGAIYHRIRRLREVGVHVKLKAQTRRVPHAVAKRRDLREMRDGPRCDGCRLLAPCLDCPADKRAEDYIHAGAGPVYPEGFTGK